MLKFFHQSQNAEPTKNKETAHNEEYGKQKQRSNEENSGEDFVNSFEMFLRILGMQVFAYCRAAGMLVAEDPVRKQLNLELKQYYTEN